MSVWYKEEAVDGVGVVLFSKINNINLSPIYRKLATPLIEAEAGDGNLDMSKVTGEVFTEIRDELFANMFVQIDGKQLNLMKNYEDITDELGLFIELPLIMLAVKVYLGKHLKQALAQDSAVKKALVAVFPKAESILTGFSGDQLLEKLQPSAK